MQRRTFIKKGVLGTSALGVIGSSMAHPGTGSLERQGTSATGITGRRTNQGRLKLATCQFPVTGNIRRNSANIKNFIKEAAHSDADVVHFSEAALSGYPPRDIP